MSDRAIPNLPAATSVAASDLLIVEQGGTTKRATPSLLPFLQSGSGASSRTAQAKMREWISAEDFGAVGDGSTDDTAAITAAITAAKAAGVRLILTKQVYKANISITGENVHIEGASFSYNASGTVGIVPATLTDPTIAIGDGTTTTRNISLRNISLYGANTGDKGLRIYGANDVHISRFTARAFEQYQIQFDSSGTLPTFFVFFDGFHIQNGTTAGSLGVDFNFGSQYTTAIYMVNGAFNANSGSASYLIDLNGSGARLQLANVWIEAGNNQGINFGTTGTVVECANVSIDSTSSAHSLITLPINTAVGDYLKGTVTVDGVATMPGGATESLTGRYHFPNNTYLINPNLQGALYFHNNSANAWEKYPTASPSQSISRTGTNLFLTSSNGSVVAVVDPSAGTFAVSGAAIRLANANNGQEVSVRQATALVSTTSGATVTSSNLIPANSMVVGVTIRVTTEITGATSISIGDGTDADRWGAGIALTAGTTTNIANFTITNPVYYAAATSVVLTAAGSNFTAGAVRITVHYMTLVPATS